MPVIVPVLMSNGSKVAGRGVEAGILFKVRNQARKHKAGQSTTYLADEPDMPVIEPVMPVIEPVMPVIEPVMPDIPVMVPDIPDIPDIVVIPDEVIPDEVLPDVTPEEVRPDEVLPDVTPEEV